MNEIENTYLTKEEIKKGKKIVILHGDYSRTTQMKGCISTPNIGMKKILLSRFDIVEVNEFNTSKLYNILTCPCRKIYSYTAINSIMTYICINIITHRC